MAPLANGPCTLPALGTLIAEVIPTEGVDVVLGHSVASVIVSMAVAQLGTEAPRVVSLEGNLTAEDDGFLRGKRFLILDLDKKFTDRFRQILADAGIEIVRTAYQAPDMNAFAERWAKP